MIKPSHVVWICQRLRGQKTYLGYRMSLKKQVGAVLLAFALAPGYVIAQDMEFNGTIANKEE